MGSISHLFRIFNFWEWPNTCKLPLGFVNFQLPEHQLTLSAERGLHPDSPGFLRTLSQLAIVRVHVTYHRLFNPQAKIYAQVRPTYPAALYGYLGTLCQMKHHAWDCACGNGQVAVDLVNHFQRVQATDVSQQQITHAIRMSGLQYAVGLAEAPPFADDMFDLVCVAQALHWFDFDTFWPEIKRVLKPGGIFAAWGYSFFAIEPTIDEVVASTFLDPIRPYWADRNRLLWDHYRTISFPFTELSPPNIPLVMDWSLDELFTYLRSWSSTQRCVEDQGDGFLKMAYQEVSRMWGDRQHKRAVDMDFCLWVGRN